jgi:hypothetical protein
MPIKEGGNLMATLTILDVGCIKKQDTVGHDSIIVRADGEKIAGPFPIGKGDVVPLHSVTHVFNDSVDLALIEVDGAVGGSNDEHLGSVTVKDTPTGPDPVTDNFNRLSGASYFVKYKVT